MAVNNFYLCQMPLKLMFYQMFFVNRLRKSNLGIWGLTIREFCKNFIKYNAWEKNLEVQTIGVVYNILYLCFYFFSNILLLPPISIV